VEDLDREIKLLEEKLRERRQSLPRHSVTASQYRAIEDLEDQIRDLRKRLEEKSLKGNL